MSVDFVLVGKLCVSVSLANEIERLFITKDTNTSSVWPVCVTNAFGSACAADDSVEVNATSKYSTNTTSALVKPSTVSTSNTNLTSATHAACGSVEAGCTAPALVKPSVIPAAKVKPSAPHAALVKPSVIPVTKVKPSATHAALVKPSVTSQKACVTDNITSVAGTTYNPYGSLPIVKYNVTPHTLPAAALRGMIKLNKNLHKTISESAKNNTLGATITKINTDSTQYCKFCLSCGNNPYHGLYDKLDKVVCPKLLKRVCPICGKTGHTLKYCDDYKRYRGNRCYFCFNSTTKEPLLPHDLKDEHGNITCPVLLKITCPVCGKTGNNAHTSKYCTNDRKILYE